jgi:hypothetical protein
MARAQALMTVRRTIAARLRVVRGVGKRRNQADFGQFAP